MDRRQESYVPEATGQVVNVADIPLDAAEVLIGGELAEAVKAAAEKAKSRQPTRYVQVSPKS